MSGHLSSRPVRSPAPATPVGVREKADSDSAAALAAALDPIITIDAYGVIESASDSVARVFGWTPAELIGRNVNVLMPEPHRSAHDGYLARFAETGTTRILNTRRRFEALHKDGGRIPIELSVSRADVPTRADPLFVGIIRDVAGIPSENKSEGKREDDERQRLQDLVTEQTKALEQAHMRLRLADRMVSIGTLAAGLGHDMNNVLLPVRAQINVLLAASDRLLTRTPDVRSDHEPSAQSGAPEEIHSAVQSIAASVAYLQHLADGLRYLAQNPDNAQPDQAATDLSDWWHSTGVVIGKSLPRHVKLTASIARGLPPVRIAPHRLTQAVLNLVVNAGEAIPSLEEDPTRRRRQGRVRLTARAETDDAGHAWVLVAIADNGTGMTPEVKRRAFELFFTTKSRGNGTGLGLPLVHKVAVRVGGHVEIESEVGKGTTVTMRLPAATACLLEPVRLAAVTIADARVRTLVRHVLEAAGVEIASSEQNPAAADLWVTDAAGSSERRATGHHRPAPYRVTIPPSAGFQVIRDLIGEALTRNPSSTKP